MPQPSTKVTGTPLPDSRQGMDAYLAEAIDSAEDDEGGVDFDRDMVGGGLTFNPDTDEELTVYGAALLALERAADVLRGRKLSARANALRSFLIDMRNRLRK